MQERLIPVPYSKSSTDQAVSAPLSCSIFSLFLSLFCLLFSFLRFSLLSRSLPFRSLCHSPVCSLAQLSFILCFDTLLILLIVSPSLSPLPFSLPPLLYLYLCLTSLFLFFLSLSFCVEGYSMREQRKIVNCGAYFICVSKVIPTNFGFHSRFETFARSSLSFLLSSPLS